MAAKAETGPIRKPSRRPKNNTLKNLKKLKTKEHSMITIKLCLFASLSETLNTREELIPLPTGSTVAELKHQLMTRGEAWQKLNEHNILCAVNHEMLNQFEKVLKHNDEVAFFPPVTGG